MGVLSEAQCVMGSCEMLVCDKEFVIGWFGLLHTRQMQTRWHLLPICELLMSVRARVSLMAHTFLLEPRVSASFAGHF